MGSLYRFESYLLDERKRALSQGGSPVLLTPKAFDVPVDGATGSYLASPTPSLEVWIFGTHAKSLSPYTGTRQQDGWIACGITSEHLREKIGFPINLSDG